MEKPIKLCKDCKWRKRNWFSYLTFGGETSNLCFCPALSENLVTGSIKPRPCIINRNRIYFGGCGPGAKYFEPKE